MDNLLNGFCYDIEADNLYLQSTTIWYIRLKSLDGERTLSLKPFEDTDWTTKFSEWVHSFEDGCKVVGHNILGYDQWMLWRHGDLHFRLMQNCQDIFDTKDVKFVDTYYLSMFLNPDRAEHNLAYLAGKSGTHKIDYRQVLIDNAIIAKDSPKGSEFKQYTPFMDEYCNQDVDANIQVYIKLYREAVNKYGEDWTELSCWKTGQKSFYLMKAQEYTGCAFDREAAIKLEITLVDLIAKLAEEVEPLLPPRPLKKTEETFYRFPAKPYKMDGTFSATMVKFIERHEGKIINNQVKFYGTIYSIVGGSMIDFKVPMKLADQSAIKDYFLESGWKPTIFNYQKDSNGKMMRDARGKPIPTTPKMQETGKICENLLELDGELPKKIVRFMSLRNRLGILQGWLKNWRLDFDGRLSGSSTGIAPTHRQLHSIICNVPKAQEGVLFGHEFRALFCAEGDNKFVGCDAAAGEARTEAHYTTKYDNGKYAEMLLQGDSHSYNATIFYPEETRRFNIYDPEFNKDDPVFKPLRSKSKNGKYALTFGCSADKLASTLGVPSRKAKQLYESFWDNNPALKELKLAVERYYDAAGKSKGMPAIDGRLLVTRSKHSLLNLLFQSALAIVMDMACCLMDGWLGGLHIDDKGRPYYKYKGGVVKRVLFQHDEFSLEISDTYGDRVIEDLAIKAIEKAGEMLKVSIKMAGESKIGLNWSEVH